MNRMNAERPRPDDTKRLGVGVRTVIIVATLVVILAAAGLVGGLLDGPGSGEPGGGTVAPVNAATPVPSPTGPGFSTSSPTPRAVQKKKGKTVGAAPTTGPHETLAPVRLDGTARPGSGIMAELSSIRAIESSATVPGDVAGPALEVEVAITNDKQRPVDLTQTVVNLYYGAAATPGEPNASGSTQIASSVAPGKTARATFVFRVPRDQRGRVTVELDMGVRHSVALFRGRAPVS